MWYFWPKRKDLELYRLMGFEILIWMVILDNFVKQTTNFFFYMNNQTTNFF